MSVAWAHAVLDVVEDEKLTERVAEIGPRRMSCREKMAAGNGFTCIRDVPGLCAMVAIELVKDHATCEPDTALVAMAQENGLVLLSCGSNSPLTSPFEQVEKGLDILERSLGQVLHT
jgi:4-aminobutyrate aminotransferase-like enzyme